MCFKFKDHHHVISGAAFIAGLVVWSSFASFDRKTEVEEHGLVPGSASSDLIHEWPGLLHSTIASIEQNSHLRAEEALRHTLMESKMIVHRVNFSAPNGAKSSVLYTCVGSQRGDSREAAVIVISTNWTAPVSKNAYGMALGVVLAQYLNSVMWLSKDVFVVFVDKSLPYGAGARAWLKDYLSGLSAVRRGVLRQAIVLDLAGKPMVLEIQVEGINGMLPNQDIVNTYIFWAEESRVPTSHPDVWTSVMHHFGNGGVHSSHAPFLELHVPAFTLLGRRSKKATELDVASVARSVEGLIRSISSNLQQLHHSFNFYFFTGSNRHISSGLYLYPVFAMQLPLLSYLMAEPSYRDIRSLLVGLVAVIVLILAAGSPAFLLATDAGLASFLGNLFPGISSYVGVSDARLLGPPECKRFANSDASTARSATIFWLGSGAFLALIAAVLLRQYAFRSFADIKLVSPQEADNRSSTDQVLLPVPLWEAMRAASGFLYLVVLASLTIAAWSLAAPMTIVSVPVLVLMVPFSCRRRPFSSLMLIAFLGLNGFLLCVPPEFRAEVLAGHPSAIARSMWKAYHEQFIPMIPSKTHHYLPTRLVNWLHGGLLGKSLSGDLLVSFYMSAQDFNCVGGMLFPVICFAYWPLLALTATIGMVLPAQRMKNDGLSLRQLRNFALIVFLFLLFLLVSVCYGVVWRSTTSSGLGKLEI